MRPTDKWRNQTNLWACIQRHSSWMPNSLTQMYSLVLRRRNRDQAQQHSLWDYVCICVCICVCAFGACLQNLHVCHLLAWCPLVCVWELTYRPSMCAPSRHTFYYWQQSFNKASFYGGIRLKPRSLRGTKRKSLFSVEWEWSSVIISWCRLASPGALLWSLMKLRPLFLLLLTHATFTFKIFPVQVC